MKKIIFVKLVLLSFICLTQTGCIVAAIGAGVGAVKYANSKKTQSQAKMTEAKAKTMESYNQYVLGMQKINIERQSKGLSPVKIMTYHEYCEESL